MTEEVYFIKADPYGDMISLVFTTNINKSIRGVCKRLKISPKHYLVDKCATAVVCNVEEKNYRATWVVFNIDHYNEGIVVHECLHLTYAVLSTRDIFLNDKAEEAYAYLIQWFYNTITEKYKKFRKKHK